MSVPYLSTHRVAVLMTQSHSEKSTPAPVALAGTILKALTRDPRALRVLIACVLAVVSTAIEPPYLSLSTPEVQSALRAPESRAPLYVAAGFLVLAIFTLLGGTTGDLFGRRKILLVGLVGVLISNVLGIFTLGTEVFRYVDLLNTVTSALVVPMAIAIVTLTFESTVRPFAYGMIFGFQGAALALSPLMMSLAEVTGLSWIAFVPVVIIGVLAIYFAVRHVQDSRAPSELRRSSVIINLLLLAIVFGIVFVVISARSILQNWIVLFLGLVLLIFIAALARWVVRRVTFLENVDLFSGRDIVLAIFVGVILSVVQGSFFYQFATFNYEVQQTGALIAALRVVPFVLGLMVASFLIARLALTFGARRIIVGGALLMAIGLLWVGLIEPQTSYWFILVPITMMGFGFGLATPARTQIILSAPPTYLVGSAAAVNTAAGQSGYALGVAVSSTLITQLATAYFLDGVKAVGVSAEVFAQVLNAMPSVTARTLAADYPNLPDVVTNLVSMSYDAAFTTGMAQMFVGLGIALLITALVIYVFMSRGLRATIAAPLNQIKLDDS